MPSTKQTAATLKVPKTNERPRFAPGVALPLQAHIWIRWLTKVAAAQEAKGKEIMFLSTAGARDLAALIDYLARGSAPDTPQVGHVGLGTPGTTGSAQGQLACDPTDEAGSSERTA